MDENSIERRIKTITIKPDLSKVVITFVNLVDAEPREGEEESTVIDTTYTARSKHRPHQDFVNAMKKLLPHALASGEINLADKTPAKNYSVNSISIDGDILMDQARVTMTILHTVERTGKVMQLGPVPQVTLSDESDYKEWQALQKLVNKVIDEAWKYLKDKHEGDRIQLAFSFPDPKQEEAEEEEQDQEAARERVEA